MHNGRADNRLATPPAPPQLESHQFALADRIFAVIAGGGHSLNYGMPAEVEALVSHFAREVG